MICSDKSSKELISKSENKKAWRSKHRQAINSMISFMAMAFVPQLVLWVEGVFAQLGSV